MVMGGVFDRLEQAVRGKRSPLVLGLDPRPERMPTEFRGGLDGITGFHAQLIDVLESSIVAIKPQIAFFEALGIDGLRLYAETCRLARERGLVVIGDVKRGDIGSTAEAYARAHFAWADILTVNPYLGDDSIEPFLAVCREQGKGIFVLCATSNPGWTRFQSVEDSNGRPLYLRVADAIAEWTADDSGRWGPIGAVVGGTHPAIFHSVREVVPRSWLLLPGIGPQGARPRDFAPAFAEDGTGVVTPVSRGLASCFEPDDPEWVQRVEQQAAALIAELRAGVPALDA